MVRSSVAAFYALSKRLFYSVIGSVGVDRFFILLLLHCIGSEIEKIVHWMTEILFAAEITFCGLHRGMSQQKLNLFQFTTAIMTQLRTSPALMPHAA